MKRIFHFCNRWIKDLRFNFKDYRFVRMEIVDSSIDNNQAKVTFRQLAIRKTDNVMYPTQEVSLLIKAESGQWLYEKGDVTRPPAEVAMTMMETWPEMMGIELVPNLGDVKDPEKSSE